MAVFLLCSQPTLARVPFFHHGNSCIVDYGGPAPRIGTECDWFRAGDATAWNCLVRGGLHPWKSLVNMHRAVGWAAHDSSISTGNREMYRHCEIDERETSEPARIALSVAADHIDARDLPRPSRKQTSDSTPIAGQAAWSPVSRAVSREVHIPHTREVRWPLKTSNWKRTVC